MKVTVFGCEIDDLTLEETVERVGEIVRGRNPCQQASVNVDKVVKASRDASLRAAINACAIVNADGMPIVWASHLLGRPLRERVAGVDLFQRLLQEASRRQWRVFLLGAKEEVLVRVVDVVRVRYPGLVVAGSRNGYWPPEEEDQVVEGIRRAEPDLLFVAINSPRKELFLATHLECMAVPFAMGVGGSFDVVAGVTRRAPRWMQRCGFEWLYRFLQEPRRMFRRYFVDALRFLPLLLRQLQRRS